MSLLLVVAVVSVYISSHITGTDLVTDGCEILRYSSIADQPAERGADLQSDGHVLPDCQHCQHLYIAQPFILSTVCNLELVHHCLLQHEWA